MMEPITRREVFMKAVGEGKAVNLPTPITREERYLAKAADLNVTIPEPITRKEMYLHAIANSGGSGGVTGEFVLCGEATEVGVEVFKFNKVITGVSLPNATSIGDSAFQQCEAISQVYLPKVKTIGDGAFTWSFQLEDLDLPNATRIGTNAFEGCKNLKNINLPEATSLGECAFSDCDYLECIKLPKVTNIDKEAFWGCNGLDTIILSGETLCTINLTAILATKIATPEGAPTGEGFIYVPSALYEDYVANFVMQITVGLGQDEATAEYIARAILRKIDDYP